jgi:O-antigen/teichoic acid export membrane protein
MATLSPAIARVSGPVRRALASDFLRHSALVFGATMAGNVLNYLFNFALSRRLGVEGFATLSSLVSFIMIFSIPASIVTLVIVKYTATFHAAGDTQRVRRLSQVLLKWTAVAAIGALALGLSLHGAVSEFLRIPDDAAVPLCIGILALSLVTPSVRAILQGEQDFVRYSVSTVLEVLLKVAVAVVLVYSGFGVVGAMSGWILGTTTALLYTIWAVMRKHGSAADASVRLSLDMRRLLQTTLGVGLASAFLIIMSFADVMLVKHYFVPKEAGLYAAVNLTGKVVLFLAGFVPAVLLPKAVAKSERGENPIALLMQSVAVTLAMSGCALAVFGMEPALVVRILAGRDFIAAAPYVLQYDAAMCLLAVATLLVNFKIGIHRFDFLYGLGAVLVCEIVAIALFHRTLWDIVHILLLGNAFAALSCCGGLWSKAHAVRPAAEHA